ncbi:MAG: hypothetical protein M3O92_03555 [Actinomycetota bacterium]|nr:hypothetical protein [Actinomycetota bacterium]
MNIGQGVRAGRSRVTGWRAWTVIEMNGGVRLASVIYDTVWDPGGPAVAACQYGEAHVAPALACTCGFHAARDPVDALTYLQGRDEPKTLCRILGEVLLSGVVVETEAGYRGAAANPLRLYANDLEVAAELETTYRVPVLSPGCEFASATSSTAASAGSSTSSCSAARTPSSWTAASG